MVEVRIQRSGSAELPAYGYPGDAGMDLAITHDAFLEPGESMDLPTGLRVELPEGVWARITGRSSTLRKRGLFVNEGVIDQGYRGELFIYVTNRNDHGVRVEAGARLAQLILSPVLHATITETDDIADSARGDKGFGSTGHREWTRVDEILTTAAHVPDNGYLARPGIDSPPVTSGDDQGGQGHTDSPDDAEGSPRVTERLGEPSGTVYLGGPIDYHDENPEARHRRFILACQINPYLVGHKPPFFDVYCPACRKKADESPLEAVQRNNAENRARDWGVFEYDAREQPSFGTPIEIWDRFQQGGPVVVVGSLGDGLFGQLLRQAGVVEVGSMNEAVGVMVGMLVSPAR